MIEQRGETAYFRASSASVRFRDGLRHEFGAHDDGDDVDNDGRPRECIDFFSMAIGDSLRLSYNSTACMVAETLFGGTTCAWPHWENVVMSPHREWHEDSFNWQLSQAWVTPGLRWEWILWRYSGVARVPVGYDAMRCDSMDLLVGSTRSSGSISVRDMTLGAYLPRNYSADGLRLFAPCGGRECRIINNVVFCQGMPKLHQLVPLVPGFMLIFTVFQGIRQGRREGIRRARTESGYEMVDVSSVVSVAAEDEWERRRREEARVRCRS